MCKKNDNPYENDYLEAYLSMGVIIIMIISAIFLIFNYFGGN
jgi:hypothetical protein